MSVETFESAVDIALQAQGYRPVNLSSITDDGGVSLPAPTDAAEVALDSALRGAVGTGNWGEIGRQLAQFRHAPGFRSLYVRRDRNLFRLVIVQRWSGLTLAGAESELRRAWIVFEQLAKWVPSFQLPNKAALDEVLNQFSGALAPGPNPEAPAANANPTKGTDGILALRAAAANPTARTQDASGTKSSMRALGVALLRLVVAIAESGGAAIADVVMISSDGLAPDLVGKLNGLTGVHKQAVFTLHNREVYAVGVDERDGAVHGRSVGIDVGDFEFTLGKELADQRAAVG